MSERWIAEMLSWNERPAPRPRKKNAAYWSAVWRPRDTSERNAEIVRLRRDEHLEYETIGERFGITRERVRQILRRFAPDLTGLENCRRHISAVARDRACSECGATFRPPVTTPQRRQCSARCYMAAVAKRVPPHLAKYQAVYEARVSGMTWAAAAEAAGFPADPDSVFSIHSKTRRWAMRAGVDLGAAFGCGPAAPHWTHGLTPEQRKAIGARLAAARRARVNA